MSLNLNSLLADLEKDSGITKQASVTETAKPAVSAELASVLEKKASEDLTAKAFSEGEALAKALLEKMAENNIIADNNAMVADDNTKVLPNPQGTVEDVLEGVVANAKATGASTDNRVDGEGPFANNVDPAGDLPPETQKQAADASAQPKEEDTMNKVASDSELAKFIMEKIAQEFSSVVTTPAAGVNTAATAAPNKIIRDNTVMTAQDDAKVDDAAVQPGGDGTINALFQSIVAKAVAEGGNSDNLVLNGGSVDPRADQVHQNGGPGPASEGQEKAAAVSALVAEGMDFDMAVDLVKQAEEEILSESWEQEKQACLSLLMEEGVDFDTAVTLVKQAEEDMAKEAKESGTDLRAARAQRVSDGRKIQAGKAAFKDGMQSAATKASVGASNVAFGAKNLDGKIFKKGVGQLASNKLVRYGAGATALAAGAAALARSHEKKACIDALVAEGIDFDTAVELTKQASVEIYGE